MKTPDADPAAASTPPPPRRSGLGTAILAGVVHALVLAMAFPPIDLWWLIPLAPAALGVGALATPRFRTALLPLLVPAVGAWLWHQWWVGDISAAGLAPFALYLACWTPLIAGAVRRLARSASFESLPLALLVPLVWTGLEYLRATLVFDGYPWYLLGQPLIGWPPLAQAADLAGITVLAILPAMLGGLLADWFLQRGTTATRRGSAILTLIVVAAWTGYGLLRMRPVGEGTPGPHVLAIQTDLPQDNKVAWTPQQQWEDGLRFARQTIAAADRIRGEGKRIDVIAWPETMLPGVGLEPSSVEFMSDRGFWPGTRFSDLAVELQAATNVPLLLGSPSFEGLRLAADDPPGLDWDRRFNSVYLLDRNGPSAATRYDKVFLTPFGERMPYISAWPWLEQRLLDIGARGMQFDLDAASAPTRLTLEWTNASGVPESIGIGTPICFEDTVPSVCRELVWEDGRKAASLLLNASNDGWFGDHAGPRLNHLQLSRFRAIENRVPLVRAVNTGRSGWIDSSGRIREVAAGESSNAILARTRLDDRHPLFARVGEVPMLLVLLVIAAMLIRTLAPPRGMNSENEPY